MPEPRLVYKLSEAADIQISEIFDYTAVGFGFDPAVTSVSAFQTVFIELCSSPRLGRDRPEIRAGLKSLSVRSHIGFYRILEDQILSVRVLHGSRDIPKFL